MKVYCDSGLTEGCFVNEDEQTETVFIHDPKEVTTHNVGEYVSVITALVYLNQTGQKGAELFTDSQLVVGQTTQGWKVKEQHLLPFVNEVKRRLKETNSTLSWVPREQNLAGIVLENRKKRGLTGG